MANYCEYCGLELSPDDSFCPNCGAPVSQTGRESTAEKPDIPQTIAELKAFCRSHGMPLEQMRFFIGQDYRGARAFGIFEDRNGNFIVYKNKSDGSRTIRYRGHDEAFAVGEIYRKLQDEVSLRKNRDPSSYYSSRNAGSSSTPTNSSYRTSSRSAPVTAKRKRGCLSRPVVIISIVVIIVASIFAYFDKTPTKGYYHYNENYYYYQDGSWYYYSEALLRWVLANDVDEELIDHNGDYYASGFYRDEFAVEDFRDSIYYEDSSSSGSSYNDREDDSTWSQNDSNWDYDYDSWDSNDTDWESDW